MDGQFVPNLTFGPDVIAAVRAFADVPFEAHLMVQTPDVLAGRYVEAGCQRLIVHAESTLHLHRSLDHVRSLGVSAGVALNPATSPSAVEHVLDLVDLVLVMTVNPGFGGQAYLTSMERKIAAVRRMIDERGLEVHVEVDGGLSPATAPGAAAAGADVLVAGSALYRDPAGLAHAVNRAARRRRLVRGRPVISPHAVERPRRGALQRDQHDEGAEHGRGRQHEGPRERGRSCRAARRRHRCRWRHRSRAW